MGQARARVDCTGGEALKNGTQKNTQEIGTIGYKKNGTRKSTELAREN